MYNKRQKRSVGGAKIFLMQQPSGSEQEKTSQKYSLFSLLQRRYKKTKTAMKNDNENININIMRLTPLRPLLSQPPLEVMPE